MTRENRLRVVMDGAHFLNSTGTGVASYGRTLVQTLASAGCSVGALFDRSVWQRKGDPSLSLAAQIFGNSPPDQGFEKYLKEIYRSIIGLLGPGDKLEAKKIELQFIELASRVPPVPNFDQVWNVPDLSRRSGKKYSLSGKISSVDFQGNFDLAHWIFPVPYRARGIPNIVTIHDMIPLRFPHLVIDRKFNSGRLLHDIGKHCDHVVTVSEASKRDILQLTGLREEAVTVTYQPVPELPYIEREEAERLVRTLYGAEPGKYAFFVGAIEPKKNLRRLIEAHLLTGTNLPLYIAGPKGWLHNDVDELLDTLHKFARDSTVEGIVEKQAVSAKIRRNGPAVRSLGFIPRLHIVCLLKCAKFFVFPSIYEGFGLPVVEAMQLGVPVITSNTSSLPEVAGDAAILVDPLDVNAIAQAIRNIDSDSDLRAELSSRGPIQSRKFTVSDTRARLLSAYHKLGVTDAARGIKNF